MNDLGDDMINKVKNVPKIRFSGYTHTWEERKLGDLATSFEYGLNASAKSFDGTHKYIRITDIDDSSRKFNSQSLTSPDIDLSSADNYKLKNGDILFARTGASVGKSYIYADSDGLVYYAGFLIRARIKSGVDSNFVFQHTLTSSYENFIRVTSQRSGQPGVNAKEYSTFEISVPSYEEQRKIGSFFKQLDDTITLHQRKCDKLKDLKKGYLQKMFPKGTEKIPEIRFINFDEEWEKKKLGKLAEIIGGGTPSTSVKEYWNGDIDWYSPIEIGKQIYVSGSRKKITELGLQKSSAKMLPIDTVLFTSRAGIGNTTILKKEGCTNQGFQSIVPKKNKLDAYFIFSRTHELKVYGETKGAGSTFVEVSGKQMTKMLLKVPKIDEQIKIGNLFQTLDQQVNQQETKLKYLKQLKQAYLQNMFV